MLGVNTGKEDCVMKCPACGRGMYVRGNHFECPNILCDYEEEIEDNMILENLRQELKDMNLDEPVTTP